ncbi:hypothetical protein KQI79_01300 [Paenibacillus sp. MSJ-34]|nr:hypothetical protein [Paenibacillus sp. MSJ-34]MBU5440666.1 hypothetical protein [Paenibacillus sp. MSJ-34]
MSYPVAGVGVGPGCGGCGGIGGFGGIFTSTGVILVLFILLVIVSRSWIF